MLQGIPVLRGQISTPLRGRWLWDKESVPVKTVPSGKCSHHHCCSHSGVTRGAFITFVGLICIWTISGCRENSLIQFLTPSGKSFGQGFCFTMNYTLHPGYEGPFWISVTPLSGGLVTATFLKCIAACISANNTEWPKHGTCGVRSELGVVDHLQFGGSSIFSGISRKPSCFSSSPLYCTVLHRIIWPSVECWETVRI